MGLRLMMLRGMKKGRKDLKDNLEGVIRVINEWIEDFEKRGNT